MHAPDTKSRRFPILTLFVAIFLSSEAFARAGLDRLFTAPKPVIAALYLEVPKAQDAGNPDTRNAVVSYAASQIRILEENGVDAILWEFRAGGLGVPVLEPAQITWMVDVMKAIIGQTTRLVTGLEILWHYPEQTLLVAERAGAAFVRIDFFSDDMIADGVRVPIDPPALLRYRRNIGAADVVLLTDIQVKYATMVNPDVTMTQSARNAVRQGSDGVIVSGARSGQASSPDRVRDAAAGAGSHPVIIGSGFSPLNARDLLQYADAAIVGTAISVKTGGPLDPAKVADLMTVVRDIRRQQP